MRHSARLIEQILEIGKARGLSAGAIACQAGVTPASLSRARRTGRYNADTLERLLVAVDGEIAVRQRERPPSPALALAAGRLNAGRREFISELELRPLLTKFRRSALAERAYSHLVGVVEELSAEHVQDQLIAGDATLPALSRIALYVKGEGPTVDWIHEQLTPRKPLAEAS